MLKEGKPLSELSQLYEILSSSSLTFYGFLKSHPVL